MSLVPPIRSLCYQNYSNTNKFGDAKSRNEMRFPLTSINENKPSIINIENVNV